MQNDSFLFEKYELRKWSFSNFWLLPLVSKWVLEQFFQVFWSDCDEMHFGSIISPHADRRFHEKYRKIPIYRKSEIRDIENSKVSYTFPVPFRSPGRLPLLSEGVSD